MFVIEILHTTQAKVDGMHYKISGKISGFGGEGENRQTVSVVLSDGEEHSRSCFFLYISLKSVCEKERSTVAGILVKEYCRATGKVLYVRF